ADWKEKPRDVAKPLLAFGDALVAAGFEVACELWDGVDGCNGIDDLLAAGKKPVTRPWEQAREEITRVVAVWNMEQATPADPSAPGLTNAEKLEITERLEKILRGKTPAQLLFRDRDLLEQLAKLREEDFAEYATARDRIRRAKVSIQDLEHALRPIFDRLK